MIAQGGINEKNYKRAKFDTSATDTTVVAAVAGKKICVHAFAITLDSDATARLESGTSGTDLSGQLSFASNGGLILPFSSIAWLKTTAGALLNLEISAGGAAGFLIYSEE